MLIIWAFSGWKEFQSLVCSLGLLVELLSASEVASATKFLTQIKMHSKFGNKSYNIAQMYHDKQDANPLCSLLRQCWRAE